MRTHLYGLYRCVDLTPLDLMKCVYQALRTGANSLLQWSVKAPDACCLRTWTIGLSLLLIEAYQINNRRIWWWPPQPLKITKLAHFLWRPSKFLLLLLILFLIIESYAICQHAYQWNITEEDFNSVVSWALS